MAAEHQVALPGWPIGGRDEHVDISERRPQAALNGPGQIPGPSRAVCRIADPTQFQGSLEQIVPEEGQLDGGVLTLVDDDLAQILGTAGTPGRQVGSQALVQLAQQDGELVLLLAGTRARRGEPR